MPSMKGSVGKYVELRLGEICRVKRNFRTMEAQELRYEIVNDRGASFTVDVNGYHCDSRIDNENELLDVATVIHNFCCDLRKVRVGDVLLSRKEERLTVRCVGEDGVVSIGGYNVDRFGAYQPSQGKPSAFDIVAIEATTNKGIEINRDALMQISLMFTRCLSYVPHLTPETFLLETGADCLFKVCGDQILPK